MCSSSTVGKKMTEQNTIENSSHQIESFFDKQNKQDLLRFITCGSVDDGKSTLIGRMLWESHQLFDDQLASLQAESKKFGTQGDNIDFALLVDGLAAEREQGITIDVAYRFFATKNRKFIVADTPGHEQYTRNMVTGASTADLAIVLIDATQGVLTQTRRHAFLCSLMGIKHIVLAINKMDLINYDEFKFLSIQKTFNEFTQSFHFTTITAIPLSALKGDNITQQSQSTPWYSGPTLISHLENIDYKKQNSKVKNPSKVAFPVQLVNRPNSNFRGYCGTIINGNISKGDEIRVTRTGQTANIEEIVTFDGDLESAEEGKAITLVLNKEIDASRGDVFSLAQSPLEISDQFETTVVWMSEDKGLVGRNYEIKLANQWASVSLTNIKYGININTFSHDAYKELNLNDIAVCNISVSKPIVFDSYENSKILGSFILVDKFTHATVAVGLIKHSLRRAQNVHQQALSIKKADRERLNGHTGKVIWFTGLSGSGKSTIANALEIALYENGKKTYILDGDNVRQGLNKDLGFKDADRVENIRRIAEVSKLMMDAGLIVMTAFISPFERERQMAKELIGSENFIEIYVKTPLEVCEQRDVKGLYKKARAGLLPNMSGIDSPYENPLNPNLVVDTTQNNLQQIVAEIIQLLNKANES